MGTGEVVERSIQEAHAELHRQIPLEVRLERARAYILKACEKESVRLGQLRSGSRRRSVPRFRSRVAKHVVEELGLTLVEVARQLGVCTSAIWRAISRSKREKVYVVENVS